MDLDDEGDMQGGKHLFAPRDTKLVVYEQKEEKQGLGYIRGMGKGIERAKPLSEFRSTALLGVVTAYGAAIRANHVDMDDDDDPYSLAGPSTSARPFAFTDEDEDMPVVIGGPADPPLSSSIPPPSRSRSDLDTTRWHDGRPVLNRFELDPLGVPTDKW
jgi:G patch domain-containing protein 1